MLAGIDIGCTFSKITQLGPDGKPIPIKDLSFPEYTYTPSCIFLNGNGAMVGRQAIGLLEQDPNIPLIKGFVQHLGSEKPIAKISEIEQWSAEAICALMLKKLRYDIEGKIGQLLSGVVISIPPNFTEKQKKAVSYAAAMADIQLKAVVPSPIANTMNTIGDNLPNNILVIDLGGQFLRVSLLKANTLQLLAHKKIEGFNEAFFNQPLLNSILQQIKEKNDQFLDSSFIQLQVKKVTESLKQELLTSQQEYLVKSVAIGEYIEEIVLYKEYYYKAISEGCQQIIQSCISLIETNGFRLGDFQSCILTGGASQIPLLQDLLLESIPIAHDQLFCKDPIHNATFGAALFCNHLEEASSIEKLPTDFYGKSSQNIGIRITEEDTSQTQVDTLIYENFSLPYQVVKNYYALPTANSINFELGSYDGKDSNSFQVIDTLSVPIHKDKIDKYQLELNCCYTAEGILKMHITDLQSTFFIKKDYPLFEEQTLLMLQQKQLVKNTMVNNLG